MNTIIKKLSQIEEASVKILSGAAAKKRALTEEYDQKAKDFDNALNEKTEQKLTALYEKMEAEIDARIKAQEEKAAEDISRLERHYEANHKVYVDRLFSSMTGV